MSFVLILYFEKAVMNNIIIASYINQTPCTSHESELLVLNEKLYKQGSAEKEKSTMSVIGVNKGL